MDLLKSKFKMIKPKSNQKLLMILLIALAILLVVYLGLCLLASGKDFTSNTKINGIDVGQMTVDEAIEAINNQYQQDKQDSIVTLTIDQDEYLIDLSDNLSFEIDDQVNKIAKKSKNFFTRGYQYLFNHHYTIGAMIKDDELLENQITNSNILSYNTLINTTYQIQSDAIVFTKGSSGKIATLESVSDTIKQALNDYDFQNKITYKPENHDLSQENEMETLYDQISKGAKNATLDKENDYAIVEEQVGASYDLDEAIKKYQQTAEGKEFTINATIIQPKITKELLEQNLFKDLLGTYTTNVSGTSVRRNNVRLSGEKCSNVILLPGEEFSYNGTVGQRTKANGFGEAAAYLNGETVQEVGGGVCQTSSTLYNAVMLSNLEITQRHNHTYISGYVPIGRDATVSWGGPDFKFKNNQDYPIKIVMSYSNGKQTAEIYGTKLDDTYVTITSERVGTVAYTTKYENDPTIPEGQEVVTSSGSNGAKAQSYRNIYDANGNLISSTKEAYSVYKGHERVVKRGTMKVETPVEPAPTPETTTPNQETTTPSQPTTDANQ